MLKDQHTNTTKSQVTRDAISRFNRDTVWLATGLLGTVVFAALVLVFEERQPKARQAESEFLPDASPAALGRVVAKSSAFNARMTPEPGSSVDHTFTETSLQEIPSLQTESAASTPALALTPETNRNDAQTNFDSGTLARRQDPTRVKGPKTHNVRNRSSVAFGPINVKRRLIELWHQSLAKTEKSRNWTTISNLNKVESKKAAYTAETNH